MTSKENTNPPTYEEALAEFMEEYAHEFEANRRAEVNLGPTGW